MKKIIIIVVAVLLVGLLVFSLTQDKTKNEPKESQIVCTGPGKC